MNTHQSTLMLGVRNFLFLAALWAMNVYVLWKLLAVAGYLWRTFPFS